MSDDLKVRKLTDREHVRERYGMYIGDSATTGLHHLVYELVNNSIDEVMAGHATQVTVVINGDGSVSVEDDGRGIPVEKHEQTSEFKGRDVSTLEAVMTNLNMDAKFDKESYKTTAGWNGIGLKVVNFLSRWCNATVCRDGFEHQLCFVDGSAVSGLQQLGSTQKRGTRITFQPDPNIFTTTEFDFDRLTLQMRDLAYLHPKLIACVQDERTRVEERFQFSRGIVELVVELNSDKTPLRSDIFHFETTREGMYVEAAFQFTTADDENYRTYVNDEHMPGNGTPVIGLKRAITRALNQHARQQNWLVDSQPEGEDFRHGLTAVLSVRLDEPQWAGSCRHKIINPELSQITESAAYELLKSQFAAQPQIALDIWQQGVAAKLRRTKGEVMPA